LLAATVRSFAHMPLGIYDRNSALPSQTVVKLMCRVDLAAEIKSFCFLDILLLLAAVSTA